jgi:hypothetical protein
MELTNKQHAIMRVVVAKNPDGSPVDLDQILERLEYRTTKQSLQFSLRALIAHGLIAKAGAENRRGRSLPLIRPTGMGESLYLAKPVTAALEETPLPTIDTEFEDTEIIEVI